VRLGQVLGNVLNNAAKYTEPGGRVDVEAHFEGGDVVISVRDNGAGIAPEERERIFDMFTRGTGRQSVGGLGIGLALARQLMKLHGGMIEARSAGLGKGSEFLIRMPVVKTASAGDSSAPPVGTGLEGRRVLVVDDNRDAGDSLGMILRTLGCDVRVAADGREGLAALKEFPAEVVLLDIGMPGMDGNELTRTLRSRYGDDIVLIAVTGREHDDERVSDTFARVDHYLQKPVDADVLRKLLPPVD
jgi:CheY-like chemotaxis protein